jgi:inner membrane protein
MASLGHVLVGLALARAHQRHVAPDAEGTARFGPRAIALCTLALLPDADVVAFAVGIPYGHAFGHRGASHSIVFSLVIGVLAGLVLARMWRSPRAPTVLAATLAVLSHPLLDMLTDGGLGCALYWPLSAARHFFSVTPIPVAPIGAGFLSMRGLWCMSAEALMLSPLIAYAWLARPRLRSARFRRVL